jgi:hypothetical protein
MSRGVAQAARVLGVDGALVKRWAWLFKDYLSSAANPAKGTPRSFTDGDMLVLLYVGNDWEDDPDIEAIKIGLNVENHLEDPFREHLYWHTPLLQEPPPDLDETWRHGILLVGGGRYERFELARNYRGVAKSMLEAALREGDLQHSAYPVLFAYRHTLELYLKTIGEIDLDTHSLKKCIELVEKRHCKKIPDPIRKWILELDRIDPGGTAFRYDDDAPGSSHYEEEWFDLAHFKFAMNHVFRAIDMAVLRTMERQSRPGE